MSDPKRRILFAALLVAGWIGAANAATSAERVTFESFDRNAATGSAVAIDALLFQPPGQSDRRPAVIALHGCGGLYSIAKGRRDALSLRHENMAELLASEGYIVLFPDSFGPRGITEICTSSYRARTITTVNRRLDVQGALAYLQSRPDVLPDRIAVLGWSNGASTVLAALNAKEPSVAKWKERTPAAPYLRAAVAFYPGCVESLQDKRGYAVAAPLMLLVGGSDDWTPPKPCIELAHKLGSEHVSLTVYPDTYHGFDSPGRRNEVRLDVPNGVHPGKGVTVKANPAARDDAYAKLKAYLRKELGSPLQSEQSTGAGRPTR